MVCPFCHKDVYGLTGLQELQKFQKHLNKCKKCTEPKPITMSRALDIRAESGQ